jgi:hypothetical protein
MTNKTSEELTMAKKEKAELAKTQPAQIVPQFAKPGRGFEDGSDNEDIIIPRAKLLQAMADELSDRDFKKANPTVGVGSIINSLTKEVLGEEFIPIFKFKEYVRFNGRSASDRGYVESAVAGAFLWKTRNAADQRVVAEAQFGPNGEPPLAITVMNFFALFPGCSMPVIIPFSKSSYGAGKQLFTLTRMLGGDMFSRKYRLISDMESNDKGTYAVLKVQSAGMASPEEFATAEALWQEFAQKTEIKVHDEAAEAAAEKQPY